MAEYKRNHFAARSHLNRFAGTGGEIFACRKTTGNRVGKCRKGKALGIAYENYFYGKTNRTLYERALGMIEDEAMEWMDAVETGGEVERTKWRWAALLWTAHQEARTRYSKKRLDYVKEVAMVQGVLTKREEGAWEDEWLRLSISQAVEKAVHGYDLEMLVVEAPEGAEFMVGDNPVATGTAEGWQPATAGWTRGLLETDWKWPGVVIEVPISKTTTLVWYDGKMMEPCGKKEQGKVRATKGQVQTMNWRQWCNCSQEVYGAEALEDGAEWDPYRRRTQELVLKLKPTHVDAMEVCRKAGIQPWMLSVLRTGELLRARPLSVVADRFLQEYGRGAAAIAHYPVYVARELGSVGKEEMSTEEEINEARFHRE